MRICPACATRMARVTTGVADLTFRCPRCATTGEARPEDRMLYLSTEEGGQSIDLMRVFLETAGSDPATDFIEADPGKGCRAPGCGATVIGRVRLGASQTVYHVCSCGNYWRI